MRSRRRSGIKTEQALMIEMLGRPEGDTVEQIAAATGWHRRVVRPTTQGVGRRQNSTPGGASSSTLPSEGQEPLDVRLGSRYVRDAAPSFACSLA